MNIYDLANDLGKALKNSNEYIELKKVEENVAKDDKYQEMVEEYMKHQMELQAMQMMGKELDEKQIETYNNMTENLMSIPEIAELFRAQMLFARMFEDVTKLITEQLDLK